MTFNFSESLQENTDLELIEWIGTPAANWMNESRKLPRAFTAYEGVCIKQVINATKLPPTGNFEINIDKIQGQVTVILSDVGRSTYFELETKTVSGDPIEVKKNETKIYSITFEEIHWMKEQGECANYGKDEKYLSYADCIANDHEQKFKPVTGCCVPWLSNTENPDICKGRIRLPAYSDWLNQFADFMSGYDLGSESKCLKSCLELQAHTSLRRIFRKGQTSIILNIKKAVKRTTYVKAYELFDLVVDVGSSLGLWIGLSVVGVIDLILNAGDFLKKKLGGKA